MKKVRAIVLRSPGTNTDVESAHALELAGAQAQRVHVNRLVDGSVSLDDYQIMYVPGGFSYGDDLGSGKILANKLSFQLQEKIEKFISEGNLAIGICNGFQILVKSRFLPGFNVLDAENEATLTFNDCGRFEDRWVTLKAIAKSRCVWTKGIGTLDVPCRHGEGKFVPKNKDVLQRLWKNGQVVFQYCDSKGKTGVGYPLNPNGSVDGIAGICNSKGTVLGMMPHPECFLYGFNHPQWTRSGTCAAAGAGRKIFENGVRYAEEKLV
ncbi:MAG: phosphoribosylformylglycinamidine synthase I [Candidatus Micrarchaeia archaeon]